MGSASIWTSDGRQKQPKAIWSFFLNEDNLESGMTYIVIEETQSGCYWPADLQKQNPALLPFHTWNWDICTSVTPKWYPSYHWYSTSHWYLIPNGTTIGTKAVLHAANAHPFRNWSLWPFTLTLSTQCTDFRYPTTNWYHTTYGTTIRTWSCTITASVQSHTQPWPNGVKLYRITPYPLWVPTMVLNHTLVLQTQWYYIGTQSCTTHSFPTAPIALLTFSYPLRGLNTHLTCTQWHIGFVETVRWRNGIINVWKCPFNFWSDRWYWQF